MRGFSNRWKDFPDYILGITKEIWEDRGIGPSLKKYYHPDVIVRMPGGMSQGEEATTASTLATLAEFPDRVLLGEDVIWSGTPEEGMLSSHRIFSTATHFGNGAFGPATGTKLQYRIIADCYAKDEMISDEWLIRDNGAVIRQMGMEPREWAQARVAEGKANPFTPAIDVEGPYQGHGNDSHWGAALSDILSRMMKGEFSVIASQYDRACQLEYPGGQTGHGHEAVDRFWLPLRAAFPSAEFTIHHQIGMEEPLMPARASVRWSLHGKHEGWGAFGAPSGAMVYVMGLTHAEFGPWGLRREFTLYDEAAIWMQIHKHLG